MAHPITASLLLSGLSASQAIAALKIDLHRSHATNPLWPPHARFHVVWQVLNLGLLALIEVGLIWLPGPNAAVRFYLAAGVTAVTLLAFWGALASMPLYAGALFDANGILPLRVRVAGRTLRLEMNTVAVVFGSVVWMLAVLLYR